MEENLGGNLAKLVGKGECPPMLTPGIDLGALLPLKEYYEMCSSSYLNRLLS